MPTLKLINLCIYIDVLTLTNSRQLNPRNIDCHKTQRKLTVKANDPSLRENKLECRWALIVSVYLCLCVCVSV